MTARRFAPVALAISMTLVGSAAHASAKRNQRPDGVIEKSKESPMKSMFRATQKGIKKGTLGAALWEYSDRRQVSGPSWISRQMNSLASLFKRNRAEPAIEIKEAAPTPAVVAAAAPVVEKSTAPMKTAVKGDLNSDQRRQLKRIIANKKDSTEKEYADAVEKLAKSDALRAAAKPQVKEVSAQQALNTAYKLSRRHSTWRPSPGIEVR